MCVPIAAPNASRYMLVMYHGLSMHVCSSCMLLEKKEVLHICVSSVCVFIECFVLIKMSLDREKMLEERQWLCDRMTALFQQRVTLERCMESMSEGDVTEGCWDRVGASKWLDVSCRLHRVGRFMLMYQTRLLVLEDLLKS